MPEKIENKAKVSLTSTDINNTMHKESNKNGNQKGEINMGELNNTEYITEIETDFEGDIEIMIKFEYDPGQIGSWDDPSFPESVDIYSVNIIETGQEICLLDERKMEIEILDAIDDYKGFLGGLLDGGGLSGEILSAIDDYCCERYF